MAINPKYENALYNKGYDLNALGNYTDGIKYYDKALAIDPHDVRALINKGWALHKIGNDTGAIEYYDKALAIDPNNTFALTNKDAILHMLGNNTTSGDAYSTGYSDAVADAHYAHGHGYDSSCPSGHSEAYCQNYQSGYATGWRSVTHDLQ